MDAEQTEESVDVTSDLSESVQGSEVDGKLVSYVNTINVDLESQVTADIYPWTRAEEHDLVVAVFSKPVTFDKYPETLWQLVRDDAELEVIVEPAWILALDVRGLDVSAMNLLGLLAEVGGASEDDLHALRFRWENGLDPAVARQTDAPALQGEQCRGAPGRGGRAPGGGAPGSDRLDCAF